MLKQNLITRKIKLSISDDNIKKILEIQRQYSNILHSTYNFILRNKKDNTILRTKDITQFQHSLNNINLNSHLLNSVSYDAKGLVALNKDKLIFGGKKLFFDRLKGNISKEEFKLKRLSPITSIGENNQKGNRLFDILNNSTILFKPSKAEHIILNLKTSKKGKEELIKLKNLCDNKLIALTFKLTTEYIYLSFDYNKIKEVKTNKPIKNRIFSIDQNPNYLGWSVVDWKENSYKIIDKSVISIKDLNDKHFNFKKQKLTSDNIKRVKLNNKRSYEIIKIAKYLVEVSKHYRCEIFAIENLNIKNEDKERGIKFNSLCNNLWLRTKLFNQIKKYCLLYNINLIEVKADYSSFIGNLVYRDEKLPDMVLSSIEISRRAFEYYRQYLLKDKSQEKNIVFPKIEIVKDKIVQSLEELGIESSFESLKELYSAIKKSKQKYRFLLEESNLSGVFSKDSKKSCIKFYTFT